MPHLLKCCVCFAVKRKRTVCDSSVGVCRAWRGDYGHDTIPQRVTVGDDGERVTVKTKSAGCLLPCLYVRCIVMSTILCVKSSFGMYKGLFTLKGKHTETSFCLVCVLCLLVFSHIKYLYFFSINLWFRHTRLTWLSSFQLLLGMQSYFKFAITIQMQNTTQGNFLFVTYK